MKIKPSILFWLLSLIILGVTVAWSASVLPERVATHFGASGRPDGWMSREAYFRSLMLFGAGSSLFIVALLYAIRFLPPTLLNVPDYWRSPEHYPEACDFMFRHGFWFAGFETLWFTGLHLLTVQANRSVPVSLNSTGIGLLTVAFLVGIIAWAVPLIRYFTRPKPQNAAAQP